MGRAPCCDKANVKKGPWSPEEDATLKAYIEQNGTGGNWIALPQKIGLKRCGKSCRLRWLNYLRPNIKHGGFSEEEENIICSLYVSIGSRWSIIAGQLPGRTDNDIKNYWNTRLKKKLLGKQRKEQQAQAQAHAQAQARRAKQEIKRESYENFMVPGVMNQSPYWPVELPVAVPIVCAAQYPPPLEDQAALTNFLMKLGGRFSDNHQQPNLTTTTTTDFQYPIDNHIISSPQDQLYANSMSMLTSSTTTNSIGSTCTQLTNMVQGLENFPCEVQLGYNNPQQQLNGLEGFYGMDMVNASTAGTNTTSSSCESASWGDISSLVNVYPPLVSDYEGTPQPQDSAFGDLSYFRPIQ